MPGYYGEPVSADDAWDQRREGWSEELPWERPAERVPFSWRKTPEEREAYRRAFCEANDLDPDLRLDLATGEWVRMDPPAPSTPDVEVRKAA